MKEIKFRVWVKNSNKMILPKEYADILVKGDGRLFCWTDIDENSGLIELDPKEFDVMQYAGVKDKNDIEIYEGDIVMVHKPIDRTIYKKYIVSFLPKRGEFTLVQMRRSGLARQGWGFCFHFKNLCEVIGNIYQNPELLNCV